MPPYSPFGDGVSGLAQLPLPSTLGNPPSGMDEEKQLLQGAHDDVLLKLFLNSHVARSASHSLDPDLSRHFQALKSLPPAPSLSRPKPSPPPPQVDNELKAVLSNDLSTRFATLRSSLHPSSSSSSSPYVASTNPVPSGTSSLVTAEIETLAARTLTMRRMKSRRSSNGSRTLRFSIPLLCLMKSLVTMTRMRITTLK
ncbi:hypothetical protein CRG98_028353 [Punica granatum]|uniref:Uncharacterized protein n=1 Tax=Punica granatum TaxID=22663 RepID=A0A2I0J4V6_PUNGR|nr:hypothetical protein CRG98_028353 [Punica granatum]